MKKVVICQHRLLHYRLGLFERLRAACASRGIDLHLVHGQASRRESVKKDEGSLPWAHKVENRFWEMGERDIVWQPFPAELRNADLVVVMQESRILSNYPLLLKRMLGGPKVAYWGHGVNLQSNAPSGPRERWKQLMLKRVDWWFAYTDITVNILQRAGYPAGRTTCLDNAIDTSGFKADLGAVTDDALGQAKAELGIAGGALVGLFCGSLYPDKRLVFLVESMDKMREQLPDFHCLLIGDGPSKPFIWEAANARPWLHVLGARKGLEKALYFRMADFMLNPGSVGLHVVDAFCAGLVLVTTVNARHGPEIAYLVNGVNGFMTEDSSETYAATVLALAHDPLRLGKVKAAALADAERYTLANMVDNFVRGIEGCLSMQKL
jgi:glycosyltransferase involved in cell wall biosynthesis